VQPINLHPFMIKLLQSGVIFTVPRDKVATKITVRTDVIPDWTMSYKEVSGQYVIEKYDELSVTLNYGTPDMGITFPLVQGMAFFTGIFKNATPVLTSITSVLRVIDNSGKQYQPGDTTIPSDKFVIFTNSGAFWIVYLQEKLSVQVLGTGLGFSKPYTGYMRVTTTGKKDNSKLLDKYSQKIPVGAKILIETEDLIATWNYQMTF
jgi:endoglucanase Acf2